MKLYKQMLLFIFLLILTQFSCTRQNTKAANNGKQGGDLPAEKTVEMKTITDHFGNKVEIPTNPKRIASLRAMTITVMLWDLGAPLIGTATSIKANEDKRTYMRFVEEVYDLRFQDTQLASYGRMGSDIEQVKFSQPDLIVANMENSKNYAKYAAIAPTIVVNDSTIDLFSTFSDLASWVGKSEVFAAKEAEYRQRLAEVRTKFSKAPSQQTVAYVHPYPGKAQYAGRIHYGSFTKVAYDLGFQPLPFLTELFNADETGGRLSAETFAQNNPDWLLTSYKSQIGQTVEDIYKGFDDVAPGWQANSTAYQQNQIIAVNREKAIPMCFTAMNWVLDQFQKYAK